VTGPARTMYAMRATGPDPARLTGERIPVPEPGTGEVLVEVHATAVTAYELTCRTRGLSFLATTCPV
jgi:NADPH:quinone reductase-like Zn-dependent oxidoreductase